MPLKIICVTGTGNTGKTTAIRSFLEKKTRLQKSNNKGDVLVIVKMRHKKRDLNIGIGSLGDTQRQIKHNFMFLRKYKPLHAIVCASRNGKTTLGEVHRNAKLLNSKVHPIPTNRAFSSAQQKQESARIVRAIIAALP